MQSPSSQTSKTIKASPEEIYKAFTNGDYVRKWLPPDDMIGNVHTFDASEGGKFRISLIYQASDESTTNVGKSSDDTDTFQGRFVELVPNKKIVQVIEFEAEDATMSGEMTITASLVISDIGTEVIVVCENIPEGIRPEDNEAGWRSSLNKLAALVE